MWCSCRPAGLTLCLCRTGAQARLGPLLKALTELRAAALQLVVGLGPTVPPQLSRMESVESVVLDTRSPPRPVKIAPLALTASVTHLHRCSPRRSGVHPGSGQSAEFSNAVDADVMQCNAYIAKAKPICLDPSEISYLSNQLYFKENIEWILCT